MEISEKAEKVLNAYRSSKKAFYQVDKDSEKAMRYVLNNQWSDAEKNLAKKHDKPTLTYNMLIAILNVLEGNEELTRRRAVFKSMKKKLDPVADVYQARWNALNDEQDIEEKFQVAFLDMLIKKKGGWIERKIEMNDSGYLDFHYEVAEGLQIYPDHEWKTNDYEMKGCHYIVKETWETLEDLKDIYNVDLSDDPVKSKWYQQLFNFIKKYKDSAFSTESVGYDKKNDRYMVLEMQERTQKRVLLIWNGIEYNRVDPKDWPRIRKENPAYKVIRQDYMRTIHITTILPYFDNKVVVDEDSKLPTSNFNVFPMFSFRFNAQAIENASLIDLLLDLQDDFNKGKSQAREYITKMISGPYLWSIQDKDAMEEVRRTGNQPNQHYTIKDSNRKPVKLQGENIPPDLLLNNDITYNLAKDMSMTPEAMRGQSEKSGESGVLFQQKLSTASAAVNPYYKNLSLLRKAIARDFLDLAKYIYVEDDRPIRIKTPQGEYEETIANFSYAGQTINDMRNPSLYIDLDEGQDSITAREESWNRLFAIWQLVLNANPAKADAMLNTLIELAPISGTDKLLNALEQAAANQEQLGQQQQAMELQKQGAELQKLQSTAMLNEAKAQEALQPQRG